MKIVIVTNAQSEKFQSRSIYNVILDSFSHFSDDLAILSGEDFVAVADKYHSQDILLFTNVNFSFLPRAQIERVFSHVRAYKVYVGFDDEYKLHETAYYSQFVDLLVTYDLVTFEYFRSIGINVIVCPHPVDVLDVTSKSQYKFDLSFVGQVSSADKSRYDYLSMLRDKYPNSFFPGLDDIKLEESDVRNIYFNSKVNLNFTAITEISNNLKLPFIKQRRGFKGRPLEIGASKGFCLSEFSPSLQKFFVQKHDLDYFYDWDDLIAKIDYYLEHDHARSLMKNNIFFKVSNYFSASSASNYFANKIIEASQDSHRRVRLIPSKEYFDVELDYERLLYVFKSRGISGLILVWFGMLMQFRGSFVRVNIMVIRHLVTRKFKL